MMTTAIVGCSIAVFFLGIAGVIWLLRHDERREARATTAARDQETVRLFRQMPREPEIAHDERPIARRQAERDQIRRAMQSTWLGQLPALQDAPEETSPAAPSPPAPARERPGTAAAAHVDPNPPGSVPPPLPRRVWVHPCDCERCRNNPDGPTMLPPDTPDGAHDQGPLPLPEHVPFTAWLDDAYVEAHGAAFRDFDAPLSAPPEYLHEMEDAP